MIRSLRKGRTEVELWYKLGSELIQAVNTEIELLSEGAVFRTMLKPVDNNQKMDADNVFKSDNLTITKATIQDPQIYKLTASFLDAYQDKIKHFKLDLNYNKIFTFKITLSLCEDDTIEFVIL